MPIGKPLLVNPQGIETVGKPSRLNGRVFGAARTSLARIWFGSARSSETVNGGMGVVGVTTRSRVSNILEVARRDWSSCRRAFTYSAALISAPARILFKVSGWYRSGDFVTYPRWYA